MKLKPFVFGSLAMLAGLLGLQEPIFAAKQSSSSSKHEVLCTKDAKKDKGCKHFKHNIQLQLADSNGFRVVGTEFWVTVDIVKNGPRVTIQLPLINFQTGECSSSNPFCPDSIIVPGGYLYTIAGFLPEGVRPSDLVPQSIVAASNNGLSPVFSFTQDPSTPPIPPAGYIVQITSAGELQIQSAGTFGNIIAPGPQILMPCSITYTVNNDKKLCKNFKISKGATNTTQFIGGAASDGIRDSHVNDVYKGIVGWAWNDNSNMVHKDNGTMDLIVRLGKIDKKGNLKLRAPINITNYPDNQFTATNHGIQAWDSAIAINRANPDNIVVSWGKIDRSDLPNVSSLLFRAVSFDGGHTFPISGPLTEQPFGDFGDAGGVQSDRYGNIWYSGNPATDDPAYFLVSVNGGVDFELIYIVPELYDPNVSFLEFPQYCFGGDENGQYGLWFETYINNFVTGDCTPTVGFIPIHGAGLANIDIANSSYTVLSDLVNNNALTDITADSHGKVWLYGVPTGAAGVIPYSYILPFGNLFKSPGAIDENWAGFWDAGFWNAVAAYGESGVVSQPVLGYFNSPRSILFDENRQALYAIQAVRSPEYSQNMRLILIISRDNGQTWSQAINVNSTNFANRGFPSMALDERHGHLIFGFYDGRNDKTLQSVEYMGAIIPGKTLDDLVKSIPLSNPLYIIPSASPPIPATAGAAKKQANIKQERPTGKFGTKISQEG